MKENEKSKGILKNVIERMNMKLKRKIKIRKNEKTILNKLMLETITKIYKNNTGGNQKNDHRADEENTIERSIRQTRWRPYQHLRGLKSKK